MKYDITYTCGHTATVELYGPTQERERKIAWLESIECPDCCNSKGCTEVEMHYSEYKNNYADCKTQKGSYNSDTKTIVVYVPVEEPAEGPEITAEEAAAELATTGMPKEYIARYIAAGAAAVEAQYKELTRRGAPIAFNAEQKAKWEKDRETFAEVVKILKRVR